MREKILVAVPVITQVGTNKNEHYYIGGLTDAEIRKLGAEITRQMLRTAKQQRAEKRKEDVK